MWMRIGLAALALAMGGCGMADAASGGDRFAPGQWQVESWMESGGRSARGAPGASMTDMVTLSAADAAYPAAVVFFGRFYHGARNPEVTFANGNVSGGFRQGRVDDIAAHDVAIRGTYGRDRFRVTFTYQAFGMPIDQVVEGRLIAPH
jgi:hypothetical protein